jgi:hypothetical protein
MSVKTFSQVAGTIALLLSFCFVATARLLDITLAELVARSDVIVYGVVVNEPESKSHAVVVVPKAVLKGNIRANEDAFVVCNVVGDSESIDLNSVRRPLVVFAKRTPECLVPVHGITSTIVVRDGIAATAAIVDQPSRQSVADFLEKVKQITSSEQRK